VKIVELRRHTDADGDVLTGQGIRAAVKIGAGLVTQFDLFISSGAQRATQTLACFLSGGARSRSGVEVDSRFRSDVEDRWRDAYKRAGAGDIDSFRKADPELVMAESDLLGTALSEIFDRLADGGSALIVGHSPMQEVAVFGLTGTVVEPLSKGAGIRVTQDGDRYEVAALPAP
jgi:broad specificity phosphatase PhoE